MRRPSVASAWRRAAFLLGLLVLLPGRPAQAQQAGQDTTRSREELIRDRLRRLGPLIRRDTSADTLAADSAAADSLRAAMEARPRIGAAQAPPVNLTGVQRDSLMLQLLELEGFRATEYKSERARFDTDSGRLVLQNNAEVTENGQLLKADSTITYWERRSLACALGNPEVSGSGTTTPISGDSLCYNTTSRVGVVRNARTTVSEGADWRIQGDFFVLDERYYGHDAIFTDCDREDPHYHFAAKDMKVLRGNVIVARNVTMKFGDVPVFWLPFFVQSLERGRQSGLLFPTFSVNDVVRTNSGYERRIEDVGFYWAINDYMGAELALDWFSNNWTALRGSLDYRVLNQFMQGGLTYRQFWESQGGRQFTLSTQNSWEPNERTRMNITANYATSSSFVRNNSFDPREINRSIDSNAGVSRRFGWGSVNLSASRQQYLSDNTTNLTLPALDLTFPSLTLFEALPGDEKWYSNVTWTGSANARVQSRGAGDNASLTRRDQRDVTGRASSSFNLGNFSLSQGVDFKENRLDPFALEEDTLQLGVGQRVERRLGWNTSISYQQRLIGTSTLTPQLSMRGELLEGDTTGGQRIAAPTRIEFGASLRTDVFGFWPGVGPVEGIRHKLSPSVTYTYSPEPTVTDRQRRLFSVGEIREQNRISVSLNQTIEAKLRQPPDTTGARADSAAAADSAQAGDRPRRIERNPAIQVLSLTTSAVAYDFVQAREEGDGFVTAQITNSITSDLLRGLQLSVTHDLFERQQPTAPLPPGQTPTLGDRTFKPALTQLTASFSLNSDSWLARMIGLGRREQRPDPRQQQDTLSRDTLPGGVQAGPSAQRAGEQFGMVGATRRQTRAPRGAVGTWNANFNYSLLRPRDGGAGQDNQQLTATVSFQPTENWSLNWNTGYSFSQGEFTDHVLTLTRTLHDWDANFDFVKAQNGRFSFQFRVALRANPDIKLDYEQRDRRPFGATR